MIDAQDIGKFTNEFVAEWNGRNLNVNGANVNFDGRYGTQCMDLWNYFWTELGIPVAGFPRHVDAAGVWEDFDGKHYEYFDGILPDKPAKLGDVFIYNRRAWQNGGTQGPGHIGIVIRDNGDGTITVLETNGLGDGYEDDYMNQFGSPPRIHTWPKTNLYGYLRYIGKENSLANVSQKAWDDLVADVEFIKSELAPITTGSKLKPVKVRFRDFYVQNIRKIQAQIDAITPKK